MSRLFVPLIKSAPSGDHQQPQPRRSQRLQAASSEDMTRAGAGRSGPGTFGHGPEDHESEEQEDSAEEEDPGEEEEKEEESDISDEGSGDSDSQSSVNYRRPALVEDGVRVDPPQTWHDDWASWDTYLADYTQRTMQVLPVYETMTAEERNSRLSRTKAGLQGSAEVVPTTMGKYQRTFICTHGWKPRKYRGKGKRPRQHIRYTGCQFRFVVQLQKDVSGVWKLGVKNGFYVHNHAITPDTFGTYPTSRGVTDPHVKAHVEGMLAVGAKRSKIYDYLLDHDQNVVKTDVDNMVRRLKAGPGLSDHEATSAEIAAFNSAHPENVATVNENELGESAVISLSSAHMRKMFSRFPELVMVDTSHKTNCHNYQLLTFKDVVSGNTTLADCIKGLVQYDRRVAKQYKHETLKVGRYVHAGYDEEMAAVLRITNHFAAHELMPQYQGGLLKAEAYTYTIDSADANVVHVKGGSRTHRLDIDDWRCDCEFAMSMRLPCRHAIAYRKHANCGGPVIPWMRVDERWMNKNTSIQHVKQFEYTLFDVEESSRVKKKTRTRIDRYRLAVQATHLVSSEMADIADEKEFDMTLGYVMSQWRAIRSGGVRSLIEAQARAQPVRAPAGVADSIGTASSDGSPQRRNEDTEEKESPLRIKIAAKVNPPGRPKKDKKQALVKERTDRVWYEANEKAKNRAGQRNLKEFLKALDQEQPSLQVVHERVAGLVVKDASWENKKAKLKKMKNPVLILDAFYILPPKLLERCMALLPLGNKETNAVDLTTSTETPVTTGGVPTKTTSVEVVQVADVGQFSREQIEIFRRAENLFHAVKRGFDLSKWIMEKVLPVVPLEWQEETKRMGNKVLSTYPYAPVEGFEKETDVNFSVLYRATPPCWLNDAFIRVICERLATDFPSCRFGGTQSASQKKGRGRSRSTPEMEVEVVNRVQQCVGDTSIDTIMIPVNFPDTHWCSLIVRVADKKIFFYDSMHKAAFNTVLSSLAHNLEATALPGFDVVMLSNPVQSDLFSCGVFTILSFVRMVVTGHAKGDYRDNALTLRRFGLLYYLLTGHYDLLLENPPAPPSSSANRVPQREPATLKPDVDELEVKAPVPSVKDTETKDDDESLPPTQPAIV